MNYCFIDYSTDHENNNILTLYVYLFDLLCPVVPCFPIRQIQEQITVQTHTFILSRKHRKLILSIRKLFLVARIVCFLSVNWFWWSVNFSLWHWKYLFSMKQGTIFLKDVDHVHSLFWKLGTWFYICGTSYIYTDENYADKWESNAYFTIPFPWL